MNTFDSSNNPIALSKCKALYRRVSMTGTFILMLGVSCNVVKAENAENNEMQANSSMQADQDLKELLDIMMQRDLLISSMEGVFAQTLRGTSQEEQQDVTTKMANKFGEKFDSQNVKQEMMAIYRKYYTNEEIAEMLKFYRSSLGKKTIEIMPELMTESSQVTMNVVQQVMAEFVPLVNTASGEAESDLSGEALAKSEAWMQEESEVE